MNSNKIDQRHATKGDTTNSHKASITAVVRDYRDQAWHTWHWCVYQGRKLPNIRALQCFRYV